MDREQVFASVFIALMIAGVLGVMIHGYNACNGSYVRTLLWFECIEDAKR
jgi:hypothetical protein